MTAVQQVNVARKVLRDWLGKGGQPVPVDQAQARANICLTCPYNYKGPWIWKMATALAIKSQMDLRRIMNIHLDGEDQLQICEVCGCQIRLKVHVPFEHLYAHTADETFAAFPEFCWQKKELQQMKQT